MKCSLQMFITNVYFKCLFQMFISNDKLFVLNEKQIIYLKIIKRLFKDYSKIIQRLFKDYSKII